MPQVTNRPTQIGDDNTSGLVIGSDLDSAGSSGKLVFYGNADSTSSPQPVARRTGNTQAAANSSSGLSSIVSYGANFSTLSVAATTTAEQTTTIAGLQSVSSVVFPNKPTAQTGLGIVGYRVSAANTLGLTFANVSTAAIVPTSTDNWQILEVKPSTGLTTTATLSPNSVAASSSSEQTFTVTGAVPGTMAVVNKAAAQAGLGIANVRVTALNTVAITYVNVSGAAIQPTTSEVYQFAFLPLLVPATPLLNYTVPAPLITASSAVSTVTETTTSVLNLSAGDVAISASKPSSQAMLGTVGYRVSSSGVLAVAVMTVTSAGVPTSSESWSVGIVSPTLGPVFALTSAALNATTVPVSSTIEQTTTITGLTISSSVFANKPTSTAGLGVVGVRVSAANTLAVTYQNVSTAAVAVPAETYLVGSVARQAPSALPTTTVASYQASVLSGEGQTGVLNNEMRAALVGLNLISGAATSAALGLSAA